MYDPYNPYETQKPGIEVNFKSNRISKKKTGIGTVNAGGAIIIIIFVVLCLTIFGLLSFTTSFADKKLADKNLRSVEQYYKADSEAEKTLAMIYDAIYARTRSGYGASADVIQSAVSEVKQRISMPDSSDTKINNTLGEMDVYEKNGGVAVLYKTIMGDSGEDEKIKFYLDSEVIFYYDANTNKLSYKISIWKVVFDADFEYDNNQYNVWNGFDW